MKLPLCLPVVALLAGLWATGVDARYNATGCNADNCLGALMNPACTAAATSFCHSYTQANVTATTSLPLELVTACGNGPTQSSRLSSACSCYVSAPACGDTSSDSNNCGACGNVCITGSTCSSGTCVCANSSKPPCNAQCPDLTSDDDNCGACGHSCALGTTCQSGECVSCSSFTASCSDVMNRILAINSIISPQLVDYRIQSAILGITTSSDFLAPLGPNPCQNFTNTTEYDSCVELVADSQSMTQLANITIEVLSALQTCASNFAMGGPDYQIIINEPNNANCIGQHDVRRNEKRTFGVEDNYDLTRSMLKRIENYKSTTGATLLGHPKSSFFQLTRKQSSTCSQTGMCFERCPDCRDAENVCGTHTTTLTEPVCEFVSSIVTGAVVGFATKSVTVTLVSSALAGSMAHYYCGSHQNKICEPLTQRCANCNSANNKICDKDSTQCCAGETGTECGEDCCCCPHCFAPGGLNCACTAAPC